MESKLRSKYLAKKYPELYWLGMIDFLCLKPSVIGAFEHNKIKPSELEHRFFRAPIEPSEIRAKFFSSISSTSALRAGKFSSEPSRISSERCLYPTLVQFAFFCIISCTVLIKGKSYIKDWIIWIRNSRLRQFKPHAFQKNFQHLQVPKFFHFK